MSIKRGLIANGILPSGLRKRGKCPANKIISCILIKKRLRIALHSSSIALRKTRDSSHPQITPINIQSHVLKYLYSFRHHLQCEFMLTLQASWACTCPLAAFTLDCPRMENMERKESLGLMAHFNPSFYSHVHSLKPFSGLCLD